jgi:hypothetical protein
MNNPGLLQERGGLRQKSVVGDEAENILNLLPISIAVKGGNGKIGVHPEEDQGLGLDRLLLLVQPLEHRQRPVGGMSVAGTQHRGQGKACAPVEDEERMINVLFAVAVEGAELLLSAGGLIGGVHYENNYLPEAGMGLEGKIQKPVG